MAERSRVTNISSGTVGLPATYGGKLIPPGGSEVIANTNANVVAAFGGAHAIAGAVRVEFVPDDVPATVAAIEFGVPQATVDAGDAATLASANSYTDAAAIGANAYTDSQVTTALSQANAYTDAAIAGLPTSVVRYPIPLTWSRANIAQGLTDDDLATKPPGSIGYVWRAPRAGSLVGISVNLAGAVNAGSLIVKVIGGFAGGVANLRLQCNPVVRPDGGALVQGAGNDPYPAGAQIGMSLTTSADYADNAGGLLLDAWAYVEEAIAET